MKNLFAGMVAVLTLFILHSSFIIQNCNAAPAPVAQTGQTTSYAAGDDGALKPGVAWPDPRFVDNGNGTVTDNLTGLIWLQNASCFGAQDWATAVASANTLASPACGLTDGSVAGNWHLPNAKELKSLINRQQVDSSAWLNTVGFSSVQAVNYWSSTTYASNTGYAWYVSMSDGTVRWYQDAKGGSYSVWPVRGGQ